MTNSFLEPYFLLPALQDDTTSMQIIFEELQKLSPQFGYKLKGTSEDQIKQLEKRLNITLPQSYRDLLLITGENMSAIKISYLSPAFLFKSKQLRELDNNHLVIGDTGYFTYGGEGEMIYLDLDEAIVSSNELIAPISLYDFIVQEGLKQCSYLFHHSSGTATSLPPSIEHHPQRTQLSPKMMSQVDDMLLNECQLQRHMLSGGAYYYYFSYDAVIVVNLWEWTDYQNKRLPQTFCGMDLSFYGKNTQRLQQKIKKSPVFEGFKFQ